MLPNQPGLDNLNLSKLTFIECVTGLNQDTYELYDTVPFTSRDDEIDSFNVYVFLLLK